MLKINKPIREKACYSSVGGIFARWKIINAFLFPRGEAAKSPEQNKIEAAEDEGAKLFIRNNK